MRDEYLRKHFARADLATWSVQRYKQLPTLHALARWPFICWMVKEMFGYAFRRCQDHGLYPPKLTLYYVNTLVVQTNRRLEFYYDKEGSHWSNEDTGMLINLGKMALTMLMHNTTEFSVEDLKQHSLDVMDVTVFSGLCTELPRAPSGRRRFCFIHVTVQEFMAAFYVFVLLRVDSKNALDHCRSAKSSAAVVQSAIHLTFASPLGQYDMFLRFLCGLISPENNRTLGGNVYSRHTNKDKAVFSTEVQELVRRTSQTCPAERKENLEECLREMTQVHN